MPLFHSSREQPVQAVAEGQPAAKKHSLFHSHRDPSPVRTASTTTSSAGHGTEHHARSKYGSSLFRRSHDTGDLPVAAAEEEEALSQHRRSSSGSLLHKGLNVVGIGTQGDDGTLDPSIVRAREHVMSAEAAEAEADRALDEARRRAKEAREHVRVLEEEAKEDARRARIKQHHAAEVSNRGKVLGRHGI